MDKKILIELLKRKEYLGDGLYAHHDGQYIILSTEREDGIHWVGLENETIINFEKYKKRMESIIEMILEKKENESNEKT
jgi:hypothetical protein